MKTTYAKAYENRKENRRILAEKMAKNDAELRQYDLFQWLEREGVAPEFFEIDDPDAIDEIAERGTDHGKSMPMGSVSYLTPMENGTADMMCVLLNKEIVEKRRDITSKFRYKNAQGLQKDRARIHVPGWDEVKGENKKDEILWHRTHMIPFRFTATEGTAVLENVLFAGTAHLNHGDRNDLGYRVDEDEVKDRQHLLQIWLNEGLGSIVRKDGPFLRTSRRKNKQIPNETQFSLDDIERFATSVIESANPKSRFVYASQLLYRDIHDLIPAGIHITLKNLTTDTMNLDIILNNRK